MTDREPMQQALATREEKIVINTKVNSEAIPEQISEPVAYDKTELNAFVQNLYDEKMREGKHGHYETMFYVVHQAIKRVTTPPRREWVGLTHDEIRAAYRAVSEIEWALGGMDDATPFARAIEAKLKEKNA